MTNVSYVNKRICLYEIKRSLLLRTLLKRVVENKTGKKFRPIRDLNP